MPVAADSLLAFGFKFPDLGYEKSISTASNL